MHLLKTVKWIPGLVILAGLLAVSSCKKEDEKPKSGISFESKEMEVGESDGTVASFNPKIADEGVGREIKIPLVLDKPLDKEATITFNVSGTATRNTSSSTVGDFEIKGGVNSVTVPAGATQASITIIVFEDLELEINDDNTSFETVILTLESVTSGSAQIVPEGENEFTLKIYEDDALFVLDWSGNGKSADMDFALWAESTTTTGQFNIILNSHDSDGTANHQYEVVYLPAGFPDKKYGVSYTYYDGESDNVEIQSQVINFGGAVNGDASGVKTFEAAYTGANRNKYDKNSQKPDVKIVQTFKKQGLNLLEITEIGVPTEGSRVEQLDLTKSKFLKNFDASKAKTISPDMIP